MALTKLKFDSMATDHKVTEYSADLYTFASTRSS